MKRIISLALLVITFVGCTTKNEFKVTVSNPSSLDRTNEIVELPYPAVSMKMRNQAFIITDASGKQVPYQITYDQKVIFPTNTTANNSAVYVFKEGTPKEYTPQVYGQLYPERVDDIAWENDRIAFRAYGPALQATGEKAYGIDVWVKRVPELVVKERYRMELEDGISYHNDNGNGLDYYKVGPTLGAGTPALVVNDTIAYPYSFKTFEIVDNGPLRFTVRLTYNPLTINNNDAVIEHRTISLDAGTQLNKIVVSYENLNETLPVATGIVLHAPSEAFVADQAAGYIAYSEPKEEGNGQTYIGAVFPDPLQEAKAVYFSEKEKKERDAEGHVLAISTYRPGSEYTYYAGAGWSKWGFETPSDWVDYIKTQRIRLQEPLEVSYR